VFRSRRSSSIEPTGSTAPSSRPFKLRGGHDIVDRTYPRAQRWSRGDPGIRSWPYGVEPPGGDRGKPHRRPRERGRDAHRRAVGPWEGGHPERPPEAVRSCPRGPGTFPVPEAGLHVARAARLKCGGVS
jgi:hypothetical protein